MKFILAFICCYFIVAHQLSFCAAQTLVKNKSFLVVLKKHYPQLIVNDSFLSADAAKVKKLTLQGRNIKWVTIRDQSWIKIIVGEVDLQAFANLDTLIIYGHQIESLINMPKSLKYLDCSANQLKILDIERLNNLLNLNCSYNNLESLKLNARLFYFNLDCSHNQIKSLIFPKDISINNFNCGYNPLIELPTVKGVQSLNYSGINLNQFSNWGNLLSPELMSLECEDAQLTSLPDNLPKFLTNLNCKRNKLTRLPNNLPVNVHTLDCSYNLLTQLPKYLPWNLIHFDCSHNQIDSLPAFLPKSIYSLYCHHNKLRFLPELLPLKLGYLTCNNNLIKEILYLPCHIININADSNLIHTIGDLPPSITNFSFKNNPIFDSVLLVQKGWFKYKNNQWDKPRTKYNCGVNYAIKMNCDTCVKGYQLTAAAQNIEKLELNNLNTLLGYYKTDTLDLAILPQLKILSAKQNNFRVIVLPPTIQIMDISESNGLDTVIGLGDNLRYLKSSYIANMSYPNGLKWLVISYNNNYKDTIKTVPTQLKRLEIHNTLAISNNLKLPESLEYLDINFSDITAKDMNIFAQPLPNLQYLKISTYATDFPAEFKNNLKLKKIDCYCPKLTSLANIPPNLDSLTIQSANLKFITELYLPDSLRHLILTGCNLSNLQTVTGKNLVSIDLSNNGLDNWPVFNTPFLTNLNLRSNKLTVPNKLPASVKTLNILGNALNTSKLLALPCHYWQQFENVYLYLDHKIIKKFIRKARCAENAKFYFYRDR